MGRSRSSTWTSTSGSARRSTICPHRTARTFPRFSYPPVTPINWTDVGGATNHTHTSFEIVNPRVSYHICDEVKLRIIARNSRNESKQHGGDYFRAKIFTRNTTFSASSSTDGEVVDYNNGSYGAFFTLKWAGEVAFKVTLIHSNEAVDVLIRLRKYYQPRQVLYGQFSSKGMESQTTYCNYRLRKSMVIFTLYELLQYFLFYINYNSRCS